MAWYTSRERGKGGLAVRCLRRVFCWILVFLPLLLTAAERCAVCRRSLSGEVLKYKGELYCSIRCLKRVLPKCAVCGEPITGKYAVFTSVEGRKRRLCRHCSRLTRCFACELPGRTKRLPDGRYVCSDYEREAIRSTEEAELLLEKVRKTLESLLGEPVENSFRFRMVSYPELLKVADLRVNDTAIELGLCHASFSERRSGNKREIVKIETEILMLDHLPRRRFLEIAAHELAHHWQYHAAPYLRDRVMQEGFAEFMASLVNREFGQENLNARIEQRRDPVYGAGFRKIRSVARREGIEGVKKMLRDAGKNAAGVPR